MAQLISGTAAGSDGWGWKARSQERGTAAGEALRSQAAGSLLLRRGISDLITDPANTTGVYVFGFLVISSEFFRISYNSWLWIKSPALPLKYRIKLSNNLLERQ